MIERAMPRLLREPKYWEILENDILGMYKVSEDTCNTCKHSLTCQSLNLQTGYDNLNIPMAMFVSENPACYRPLGLLRRSNFANEVKFSYLWGSPAVPLQVKLNMLAELAQTAWGVLVKKSEDAQIEAAANNLRPEVHRDFYDDKMREAYSQAGAMTWNIAWGWGHKGHKLAEVIDRSIEFARSAAGQTVLSRSTESLAAASASAGSRRAVYNYVGQPDMCIGIAFKAARFCCELVTDRLRRETTYDVFSSAALKAANLGAECMNRDLVSSSFQAHQRITLDMWHTRYGQDQILKRMHNMLLLERDRHENQTNTSLDTEP